MAAVVISSPNTCAWTCCNDKSLNCSAPVGTPAWKKVQECGMNSRTMRLVVNGAGGAPSHPAQYPDTNQPNSLVGRLKAVLSHLGHGTNATFHPLAHFLDEETGQPTWGNIVGSGHSCASYFPLLMATLFPLKRMVMTGGVGAPLFGCVFRFLQPLFLRLDIHS